MANFELTTSSPLDTYRKKRLTDNVDRMMAERTRQRAEAAAATVSQASQIPPDFTLRQRKALRDFENTPGADPINITDEKVLTEIERRTKAKKDAQFLQEAPRTAAWAGLYNNALIGHDDLETVGFFERMGDAVARGTDAFGDNARLSEVMDYIDRSSRLLEDRDKTLAEIVAEETGRAVDRAQLNTKAQEANIGAGGDGIADFEIAEVESEDDLPFLSKMSANARGLYRYLKANDLVPGVGDIKQRVGNVITGTDPLYSPKEDLERDLASIQEREVLRAGVEGVERTMLWPTQPIRREIEQALKGEDDDGAWDSATRMARVAAERPWAFTSYMMEVVAESATPLAAAAVVGAVTRNPKAAVGTSFLGSSTLAEGAFFNELVADRGFDISTREGVQKFLKDPAVVEAMRDKAKAYGIVVGLFDAGSLGVAGKALTQSPAGNLLLQGLAQSGMGGAGELFGRLAAGEKINWTEVYMEAIAELVTTPIEIGTMTMSGAKRKLVAAANAKKRRTTFEILSGKVDTSKMRARDQETFAAAVKEVTENGPAENMFVDPSKVDEMFQDGSVGISVDEFFDAIPGLEKADFVEALENGSDLVIPTAVYAAHIAGTPVEAQLTPHIRLRSEDMSSAEADTFIEDLRKTQAELAENDTNVETVIGSLQGELAVEFERLTGELQQAGRSPAIAEREAALLVASARTGAARTGMAVSEYLSRYSLPAVRNADTVGPASAQPVIDPEVVLEAIQSTDAGTAVTPDIALIADALDEMGIDPVEASVSDVITAANQLGASGALQGTLADEAARPSIVERPDGEELMQTATLRVGDEDPKKWGIDPNASNKVRDIALKLQLRQRKLYGKINRKSRGPKTIEKMASWMADEIEFELQTPGAEATGWYTTKFQNALDRLGQRFPEMVGNQAPADLPGLAKVKSAEDARAIMTALIAITSNGTRVVDNFRNAIRVYENYRQTGEFDLMDIGMGDRADHTRRSFDRLTRVMEQFETASEAQSFLTSELTVSELNRQLKENGEGKITGLPADSFMPRAAGVFGPKLGAFYANLSGSTGYLTMDLWWTRTINRYRGDVLPVIPGLKGGTNTKGVPIGVNRFKHLIGQPDLTDKQALNIATEYAERYRKKDYKNGTEAEKAANTLYKAAFVQLAEQPEGSADRQFMIEVANAARMEVFERTGELYSIADIQALIWYYEKRLYADMGVRANTGDISYAEAVDRALKLEDRTEVFNQTDQHPRLPGLEPTSPGPVPGVKEVASKYMKAAGLPVRHQSVYATVDRDRANRIADLYDRMPDTPNDPEVRAAYEALAEETIAQYRALEELGFTFEWIEGADPYATPREAIRDMQDNKHLWVFPTSEGFGTNTEADADHPLLAKTGIEIDGREAVVNDLFRIVHDVFGHGIEGAAFGARGEENAWQAHVRMFSPEAARAMTTETRGQNSWVNFGPFGEQNRADPANTVFADQKTGLLPKWVSKVGQVDDVADSDTFYQTPMPATISDFTADNISLESFQKPGWFVVTATKDDAPSMAPVNRERNTVLMKLLEETGHEYVMMNGVYRGERDGNSFLVIGDENFGQELGVALQQESILTNKGLVFTDGSNRANVPFDGMIAGEEATRADFYSEPLGSKFKPFTLNLLFPEPGDKVAVDDGTYYGAELDGSGQMVLTHWSGDELATIDPQKAGTGPLRGPERKRDGPKKSYYGLHIGKPYGYNKENLGKYRHEVKVDPKDMYPWYEDPDGLRAKIPSDISSIRKVGAYEALIKNAGYKGYFVITGGDKSKGILGDTAVLFEAAEPTSVTVDNNASWKRSGAFNAWFGDGIVTNEDGSPKMMYHGTSAEFEGFFPLTHVGTSKAAMDRIMREGRLPEHHMRGQRTLPVYLNIASPLDLGKEGIDGETWSTSYDMLQQVSATLQRIGKQGPASKLSELIERPIVTEVPVQFDDGGPNTIRRTATNLEMAETDLEFNPEDFREGVSARLVEAAQIIREAGFDGLSYENLIEDPGSTSYVALEPGQLKSPFNAGEWDANNIDILQQKNDPKAGPRGSIILPKDMTGQAQINLFDTANLSTVLHETGHFFLWQLQRQVNDGVAFAADEMEAVKGWWLRNAEDIAAEAGVDKAQVEEFVEVGTTGQGHLDDAIHTALHEQFARGFEAYAMEGKSPSNSMRGLFESFAAWLLSVYRTVKNLNVNIDADVRSVFDRMLATDEELDAAFDQSEIDDQIAATAREMGMDEDAYRRLTLLSQEARDEGRQIARAEIMTAERAMRNSEYRARLAEIDKEETERVNNKPVNRAIQWLGYGRWLGDGQPDGLPMELRMDTELLAEEYGDDMVKSLPRGRRPVHKKDTGLSADEVAGWFGYDSGAAMLKDMVDAPKARDEIKASVKARVAEEVGDPLGDPGELEQVVADAMHGEKRGQVIVAELRAINRLGGRNNRITTRAAAKAIANSLIQKMPVREALQSYRYQNAERKHAEEASRMLAKGDIDGAFEAKRKQLVQHQLYIASRNAAEMTSKVEKLAGRLKRKGTRENLANEYLGAIDDILETYDFRKISGPAEVRRERLVAYVDAMRAAGRENELAIPPHVLLAAKRVPYKQLSVQKLQGVFDSLKNIEHMARRKEKLLRAQELRELNEIRGEITAQFEANVKGKPFNRVPTKLDRVASGIKGYFNLVRNADTVLRRIDGWKNRGAMIRYFKDDIDAAGIVALKERQKQTENLENIFASYGRSESRRMAVRQIWDGYDQAISKWDIISIALNVGNKDNFERLTTRDSRGALTKEQVNALLRNLDDRDWQFVQQVWDYLNGEFWPQIAAREERLTGVAPKKVEAQMMVDLPSIPSGISGGYYPIVYDSRYSAKVSEDQNMELMTSMMAGRFGKAQTKNGHTKERAGGGGGRTVQLGMQVLFGHINNVVHDLAYSEAVNTTWKLLQDNEVKAQFEKHGLLADHQALEWWVQDVAAGPGAGTHVLAGLMRRLKSGFTLSKLAFNMSTVAIQVTGLTQSIATIGGNNFVKGMSTYLFSARGRYRLAQDVKERSAFMAERENSFQRDVLDITNDVQLDPLGGAKADFLRLLTQAGFYAMQKVQYYAVDMPTWLGAHHQGLSQGMTEEEASIHADRMVARAQASGLYADRSPIERGTLGATSRQNEFVRLFTALGSYMFAKYNVAEEVIGRTSKAVRSGDQSTVLALLKGLTDLVLLFTVEAVMYNAIKMTLPGMEGGDEDEGWSEFLLEETLLSVASVFPFIRDGSSAVQGFSGGGAYGGISETVGRSLNSFADLVAGEANASDARAFVDLTGLMVPGVPSTAIWRAIDGAGVTGEEPSPLAIIMGR